MYKHILNLPNDYSRENQEILHTLQKRVRREKELNGRFFFSTLPNYLFRVFPLCDKNQRICELSFLDSCPLCHILVRESQTNSGEVEALFFLRHNCGANGREPMVAARKDTHDASIQGHLLPHPPHLNSAAGLLPES